MTSTVSGRRNRTAMSVTISGWAVSLSIAGRPMARDWVCFTSVNRWSPSIPDPTVIISTRVIPGTTNTGSACTPTMVYWSRLVGLGPVTVDMGAGSIIGMGISAFTHTNGERYVYAEEVFYGKSIRYRIDDLETLTRFQGNFSWGDAPSFTVTNTNDSGPGSLRAALINADWNPGPDTIDFDISGTGVHTINVLSALPVMDDPVVIDATTQPGYSGTPLIELSGAAITEANTHGLKIWGTLSSVTGLIINGFTGQGIYISGGGSTIEGNYLGTNAEGTEAVPNGGGLAINGGYGPQDSPYINVQNNVISGGISISGAGNVVVQGNKIGTNATGTEALSQNLKGISIDGGRNNLIGGTEPGQGNQVVANLVAVEVARSHATGNRIEGNLIGTDYTGTQRIGRGNIGFGLDAQGNTVGGATPSAANVITDGIGFGNISANTSGNLVEGNFIGTDATGAATLLLLFAPFNL